MPLVLSLIGQRRGVSAVEKSVTYPTDARLPNSLVAVLAVGISLSLCLVVSLSLSVPPLRLYPLKRQLESGSLTINGILEKRTVQGGRRSHFDGGSTRSIL